MIDRHCHRCQAELPPHDEGTLIFCSHCGAPQILLSEELQSQMEAQAAAATDLAAAQSAPRDARSLIWPGAMRCAALAAAIAGGLAFLSLLFPPLILLAWLWAIISPVVVIGLFQSRFPLFSITTGFGARLGLLTGLAIAAVMTAINAADLVVRRYATHRMGDFDAQWTSLFKQLQESLIAQQGAAALPVVRTLDIPEFRAGFLLAGLAMACAILVTITTAGGAFAGFARSRQRA